MIAYLIYSNKCSDCKELIQIINREGITTGFNLISIDDMTSEQIVNLKINKVPAIITKEHNGNNINEGRNAFVWLNSLIEYRRKNMSNIQNNKINYENINKLSIMETTGISDGFAYLATDHAQPKSFMPYGHDNRYKIITLNNTIKEKTISETEQKRLVAELDKKRKQENSQLEEMLKEQLKNTICKSLEENK